MINDLVTVQTITEPDRAIARLHAAHGQPTWLYYFSYVPSTEQARKKFGAAHTDEVRFVFGQPRASFAPEDLPVTNAINAPTGPPSPRPARPAQRRRPPPGRSSMRPTRSQIEFSAPPAPAGAPAFPEASTRLAGFRGRAGASASLTASK